MSDFEEGNECDMGNGVVVSAIEATNIPGFLPKRVQLLLKPSSWATCES